MTDKQLDALRLADALHMPGDVLTVKNNEAHQAAAELRRLHAINAELVGALQAFSDTYGNPDVSTWGARQGSGPHSSLQSKGPAMTDRANRAAAELIRRGWQIDTSEDSELDRQCQQCGQQISADARFCQHCGTRVTHGVAQSSLDDIEAAIVAALKEQQ